MSRRRKLVFAGTAMAAIIAVLVILLWPSPSKPAAGGLTAAPAKPARPPEPGMKRERKPLPHPKMPRIEPAWISEQYLAARARGDDRPGDTAFRATIHEFIEHNLEFAKDKAAAEGLTLEEIEELTYFGYLAMKSPQMTEIEDIVGRDLPQEREEQLQELMHGLDDEFSAKMQELVAAGATEDERWAYIQETEARYLREHLALSGLTAEQFDILLGGDPARMYAPINSEPTPPEERPPPMPQTIGPQPRPEAP